jgi:hypothetical protein
MLAMPLHLFTEVQSNRQKRYQEHDLNLTVLSTMNRKAKASKFSSQLGGVLGTEFKPASS